MRLHGGNRRARLDFSSNINPLGPPPIVYKALKECIDNDIIIKSYPDYEYQELKDALAKFYHCNSYNIIPSNGAAEAINLAVIALRPKKLIVLEPSYGEYEDLAKVLGIDYIDIYYARSSTLFYLDLSNLKKMICNDSEAMIIITNPNNPTGSYIPINDIINELQECSTKILVDGAYVELCSNCPIEIDKNIPKNFIIVRSLTKWLAIPGLRIGFMYVADEGLLNRVEVVRQPWNVNSIAECVTIKVLSRYHELRSFIDTTREYINFERARVSRALRDLGLRVFDSVTNFLLVYLDTNSDSIHLALQKRGIAVRNCKSFKGLGSNYIRISIRKPNENDELIKAISEGVAND